MCFKFKTVAQQFWMEGVNLMINFKHFQKFIPCGERTTEGSGF